MTLRACRLWSLTEATSGAHDKFDWPVKLACATDAEDLPANDLQCEGGGVTKRPKLVADSDTLFLIRTERHKKSFDFPRVSASRL